jgi:hypothetical protein
MGRELDGVRRKLDELAAAVSDGAIGASRPWGGAGVVIVSEPLPETPHGFYPDPRAVVMLYVAELSWLFEELWAGFRPVLDSMTKLEFVGRLGNAANHYHAQAGCNEHVQGLLEAVLTKARAIAADISDGTFEALAVAPGRAIADDFITAPEDAGP